MTVSLEYYLYFISSKIAGTTFFNQPFEILMLVILLIAAAFLVGIIYELYKNYKRTESTETLLFLIGMISLIPANVLLVLMGLCYSVYGLFELGKLIIILTQIPAQFTYLCVNLFAIRMTFPKKYKIVLIILVSLSVLLIGTVTWATLQGTPYFHYNFGVVYSTEIQIIRFICLIPIAVIPISVFYYYAVKIREENRARSNRSLWLGTGILFFCVIIILTSVATIFRLSQILYVPSAIILYVCFSMPEWFKTRIGWTD